MLIIQSNSARETKMLGKKLGKSLLPGDVICLQGELGSGKTCLAQGIAEGLRIKDNLVSPTFVIVGKYEGKFILYHIDLYRLNNFNEIEDLGLEEFFYEKVIIIIEWAEKIKEILSKNFLEVKIRFAQHLHSGSDSKNKRILKFIPRGKRFKIILGELKKDAYFRNRYIPEPG